MTIAHAASVRLPQDPSVQTIVEGTTVWIVARAKPEDKVEEGFSIAGILPVHLITL